MSKHSAHPAAAAAAAAARCPAATCHCQFAVGGEQWCLALLVGWRCSTGPPTPEPAAYGSYPVVALQSSPVLSMCYQCVINVLSMCSQCVLNVFSMCSQCVLNVFSMCSQ